MVGMIWCTIIVIYLSSKTQNRKNFIKLLISIKINGLLVPYDAIMRVGRRRQQQHHFGFLFFFYSFLCITAFEVRRTDKRLSPLRLSQINDGSEEKSPTNLDCLTDYSASSSEFGDFFISNRAGQAQQSQEISSEMQMIDRNRLRNVVIGVSSFAFAIINYCWQFTHPVTALSILVSMEKNSAPLTSIGNNGKPTVIDFWAPWCSNCKVAAPTLQAVEKQYGDKVNFIMVNGDDGNNWPLIQLFGVDAIPHLALVSTEGDVETALIGPMSRNVLMADIDALLTKHDNCGDVVPVCHEELPYKMFDAFSNRESRRVNFQQER
jgi:thiol-disulfide isomerase/thioredoxin